MRTPARRYLRIPAGSHAGQAVSAVLAQLRLRRDQDYTAPEELPHQEIREETPRSLSGFRSKTCTALHTLTRTAIRIPGDHVHDWPPARAPISARATRWETRQIGLLKWTDRMARTCPFAGQTKPGLQVLSGAEPPPKDEKRPCAARIGRSVRQTMTQFLVAGVGFEPTTFRL